MKPKQTGLNQPAPAVILPKPYCLPPIQSFNVIVNGTNPVTSVVQIRPNNPLNTPTRRISANSNQINNPTVNSVSKTHGECYILLAANQSSNQVPLVAPFLQEGEIFSSFSNADAAATDKKSPLLRMTQRVVQANSSVHMKKYVAIRPNSTSKINPSNGTNSKSISAPIVCVSNPSSTETVAPLTTFQNSDIATKGSTSTIASPPVVSGVLDRPVPDSPVVEENDSDIEIISPPSESQPTNSSIQLTHSSNSLSMSTQVEKTNASNILSNSKFSKEKRKSSNLQELVSSAENAAPSKFAEIPVPVIQIPRLGLHLAPSTIKGPALGILPRKKRKLQDLTKSSIRAPSESLSASSIFSPTSSPIYISSPVNNWNENEILTRDMIIEIQKKAIEAFQSDLKTKDLEIQVLSTQLKKTKKQLKATKQETRRLRQRMKRIENCPAPPISIDTSLRETFKEARILSELIVSQYRRYTPSLKKHFRLNGNAYSNIEREVGIKLFDSVGCHGYENLQEIGMLLPSRASIRHFKELIERERINPHPVSDAVNTDDDAVNVICTEDGKAYSKLPYKVQRLSNGFRQYECRKCVFTSSKRTEVQVHVKEHVPLSRIHCCRSPGCDYKTSKKPLLTTHMRKHKPRGFVCTACESAFVSSTSLKLHQRRCRTLMPTTDPMIHVCPQSKCKFTTLYAATLEAHLRNCFKVNDESSVPTTNMSLNELPTTTNSITPT